jgi:hypothetical protein
MQPDKSSRDIRTLTLGNLHSSDLCRWLGRLGDVSTAPAPDTGPGPLAIVTHSPLPNGTVNQPYATAAGGSGGTTPYAWELASGSPALPAGLSLNTTSGAIIGPYGHTDHHH